MGRAADPKDRFMSGLHQECLAFALRCEALARQQATEEQRACMLNFAGIFRRLAAGGASFGEPPSVVSDALRPPASR